MPQLGTSNEYPQHTFSRRNKKNINADTSLISKVMFIGHIWPWQVLYKSEKMSTDMCTQHKSDQLKHLCGMICICWPSKMPYILVFSNSTMQMKQELSISSTYLLIQYPPLPPYNTVCCVCVCGGGGGVGGGGGLNKYRDLFYCQRWNQCKSDEHESSINH